MTDHARTMRRRAEAARILTVLETWAQEHLAAARTQGDHSAIAHWTREAKMYTHAARSLPGSDAERIEELITTHGPLAQEVSKS